MAEDPIRQQPIGPRLHGILNRLRERLIEGKVFDDAAARDLEEIAAIAAALSRIDLPKS